MVVFLNGCTDHLSVFNASTIDRSKILLSHNIISNLIISQTLFICSCNVSSSQALISLAPISTIPTDDVGETTHHTHHPYSPIPTPNPIPRAPRAHCRALQKLSPSLKDKSVYTCCNHCGVGVVGSRCEFQCKPLSSCPLYTYI